MRIKINLEAKKVMRAEVRSFQASTRIKTEERLATLLVTRTASLETGKVTMQQELLKLWVSQTLEIDEY
jgi:hypothetical protein